MLGVIEASVRYRLGRMEFERLVVRAAGYLRGESLAELDALGESLFRRHIEARVFAAMHQVVRAHQERGHTVVVSSSALTIHAEPVARHLGVAERHLQPLRGRRPWRAHRRHRGADRVGASEGGRRRTVQCGQRR